MNVYFNFLFEWAISDSGKKNFRSLTYPIWVTVRKIIKYKTYIFSFVYDRIRILQELATISKKCPLKYIDLFIDYVK